MTMEAIQTVDVGITGAASITFSSIPQNATDLMVMISGRVTSSIRDFSVLPNGSSSSLTYDRLYSDDFADPANIGSDNGTTTPNFKDGVSGTSQTANAFSYAEIYFYNYASTTEHKNFAAFYGYESAAASAWSNMIHARWSNVAAITSLVLQPATGGDWAQYTSATLYKITKGSDGATVVA